jgi:hypothetical protein
MDDLNTNFWEQDEVVETEVPQPEVPQEQEAFWEQDEVVQDVPVEATPAPAGSNFWSNDEVVQPALGGFSPETFTGEYGPSDLLSGERLGVVKKFMRSYYGVQEIDGYSDEEMVDKYLNTMRYLEAGNTVKTIGFVDHVLSTDEAGKKAVAEGVQLFQGLAGVTSDAYSWGETAEAVKDYAWGAIVDPVNILAPMVGKVIGGMSAKSAGKFATNLATAEFKRQVAKGASQEVASVAANRVRGAALREGIQRYGKAQAYREVMGAAAFDTAVAVGTDIAYQHGLIEAGAQEDQDRFRTGLAALGGIVGGAVGAGVVALRGTSSLPLAGTDVVDLDPTKTTDLEGVLKGLRDSLAGLDDEAFEETFKAKVGRGIELEALDTNFWVRFLVGDDQTGFKGLAPTLYEQGFRWKGARGEGDNFSNWLADTMKNAPEEEVLGFVKAFQEKTGVVLKGMEAPEAISEIADNMARKLSDSARNLGAVGNLAKYMRGKNVQSVTLDDAARVMFSDNLDADFIPTAKSGEAIETFSEKFGEGTRFFQDSYIRLLVTHPGTSALNVIGWSAKSAGQSASDLLRASVIYGGGGLLKSLQGKGREAALDWKTMASFYRANLQKIQNLVDPYMTKEAFESLVEQSPDSFKDLTGILPGGVTRNVAEKYGLAATDKAYQNTTNKALDTLQTFALVKAQDVFTKSQELMYNMDIALIERFGYGYREFIARPDAAQFMNTKLYKEAEGQAIDRTLENILSKSYSRQKNMGLREVATIIEDVRKIPVLGVHVPFGRFFNNVIATTSEYSGLSAALKLVGTGAADNKSWGEIIAKPVVAWAAIASLVPREMELLERGVAWDERIDETTGQRISERYDAPAIALKWAARRLAYERLGMEVPEDFIKDGSAAIFGQMTRQLTQSASEVEKTAYALLSGNGVDAMAGLSEMLQSTGSTVASGATRFMEPINTLAALQQPSEDYTPPDPKTGNKAVVSSFRYVDQLIDALGVDTGAMGRVSPTSEYVSRSPGRMVGTRAVGPQTAATKVFAMVGKPSWDAGLFSDSGEATNYVVREFQPIFEFHAQRLLDNPYFIKADLPLKEKMLSDALKLARNTTHQILAARPDNQNAKASLIFKLTQNQSVTALESKLAEMGFEEEKLFDLRTDQLELLKFMIESEEELGIEELYRN